MIKTDKILSPILWLCGISTPFFLIGAYAFRNVPTIFLILIITAIVPIGIACITYIIFFSFTTFSPKKLPPKDDQDRHDNTINMPPNTIPNPNLHVGIDTLIEMRISEAADRLRDLNQVDLKDLNLKHTKPWQVWSILATVLITAFSIISWLIAPVWIGKLAEDYIQEKSIDKPFTELVSKKALDFVKSELDPFKTQLKIQQLASAAKAGRYDKYKELTKVVEKPPYSEYADDIDTAIIDIHLYYDALRYQIPGPLLGIGYISVDEIIGIYRKSAIKLDMRESAIGTLFFKFGMIKDRTIKENIVQELCESIDSELNLRVIARTTLLLQYLTQKPFASINKDAVKSWWEDHKKESKYQSLYKGYLKALDYIDQGFSTDPDKNNEIISFLKETTNADPNALHARCLLGGFLALTGEYSNADKEFDEVEKN
ncbi:MAG: hypothetical protein QG591_1288 [Planctomycetota bacterium]|nr:hypothetical protein [Planctomycetota bacterium]